MHLIDTHCHLNDQKAFPNPSDALQEADEVGIKTLIAIGIDTKTSEEVVELSDQFENVFASVGWHPSYSANYNQKELTRIRELADHKKVVAIGEIGLDYYWDHATKEEQMLALSDQLDLSVELKLPAIFHCREAYPDLLNFLESRPKHTYLLHCFAGNMEDAKRAIDLGCLFGVDGPVTYKSRDELRECLKFIGIERIVLETDAPYLSPVPYRGKRNRPAYMLETAKAVAELFEMSLEEVAELTTKTAREFFLLPS